MKILIVLGHPNENSFTHAIAETAARSLESSGHEVIVRDLYREKFHPCLPTIEIPQQGKVDEKVQPYCDEIQGADGIIIVHPNWWGQPPAIVKGWVDRVFRPGVAYHFLENDGGEGIPVGLLKARFALVFNTSNTPREREMSVFGDPLETVWKNCIFSLCGVNVFYRKTYRVMVTSTSEQRIKWLEEVEAIVRKYSSV